MTRPGLLQAEAIAWPLASPAAWARASTTVDRTSFHEHFHARARALDPCAEPRRVAEAVWSPDEPILQHLQRHVRKRLRPAGDYAELKEDHQNPAQEIVEWRWLSLLLPTSLLTAAVSEGPPMLGVRVLAVPPVGPVAHQHMHLGATVPFELVWHAMNLDFESVEPERATPWLPDGTRMCPKVWKGRLLAAHLARRLLAEQWLDVDPGRSVRDLMEDAEHWLVKDPTGLPDRARQVRWRRALWTPPSAKRWSDADDLLFARPDGSRVDRDLEAGLLAEGLRRSERSGALETLFLQYLRVKVALWRVIVMDPSQVGLSDFVQKYRAIGPYLGRVEKLPPSWVTQSPRLKLRAVELRRGPPSTASELLDLIAPKGDREGQTCDPVELGWIFHFLRGRPPTATKANRGKRRPILVQRWRQHLTQARMLERVLRRCPQLLRRVRAIDVAGEEAEGPMWLLLPHLDRLREVSGSLARLPAGGGQALRASVHAGESNSSSVTGLRHVDEVVRWRIVRRGDRIAHAVVLGVELQEHGEKVSQPAAERLLDVAWLLMAHQKQEVGLTASHAAALKEEGKRLSGRLLKDTEVDVIALYESLGDPATLRRLGMEIGSQPNDLVDLADRALLRLIHAWGDRDHVCVEVDANADLDAARAHQARLREQLAGMQVTVEMNPSSNLLIAGFSQPLEQPIFRLRPANDGQEVLPVTISADDPISFATSLDDEYGYAWAALVRAKVKATSAQRWLEEAAETSWRTRFTAPSHEVEGTSPPRVVVQRRWGRLG